MSDIDRYVGGGSAWAEPVEYGKLVAAVIKYRPSLGQAITVVGTQDENPADVIGERFIATAPLRAVPKCEAVTVSAVTDVVGSINVLFVGAGNDGNQRAAGAGHGRVPIAIRHPVVNDLVPRIDAGLDGESLGVEHQEEVIFQLSATLRIVLGMRNMRGQIAVHEIYRAYAVVMIGTVGSEPVGQVGFGLRCGRSNQHDKKCGKNQRLS